MEDINHGKQWLFNIFGLINFKLVDLLDKW